MPQLFPADQSLIPLAVAGAFVLPAVLAALFWIVMRAVRRAGPVVSAGVLALAVLALAGYLGPGLVAAIRV